MREHYTRLWTVALTSLLIVANAKLKLGISAEGITAIASLAGLYLVSRTVQHATGAKPAPEAVGD